MSRLSSGTSEDPWPDILRLVAHQLRIPTSLIAGYTEMLASDEIQRDQQRRREILEEIRQHLRDLNRLAVELQEAGRAATSGLRLRKEPVAIRVQQQLPRLAAPCKIDQHGRRLRIVIPDVMWSELVIPSQLAGF